MPPLPPLLLLLLLLLRRPPPSSDRARTILVQICSHDKRSGSTDGARTVSAAAPVAPASAAVAELHGDCCWNTVRHGNETAPGMWPGRATPYGLFAPAVW